MKSRAITLAFAACLISSLALAGETWTLDSSASNARLFQGSKANPDSVNTGIARVTGRVKLDTSNLDHSIFDLSFYPADRYWKHALSVNDNLPVGYPTGQTLLTFKSKRIVRTGNGKLKVIGDLTLTRAGRNVTATPTEAYAGSAYGNPNIDADTHEIRFRFSTLRTVLSSGPLTPTTLQNIGALEIVGATRVGHEDFPELLGAIKDTNWQSIVQSQDSHKPSTVGEDYSGAQCIGTVIAATSDDHCHTPASVGEDYSGTLCTSAADNQTIIVSGFKVASHRARPISRNALGGRRNSLTVG